MTKFFIFLSMLSGPYKEPYIPVCNRDYSDLSLSTKIELSIGCSKVNGQDAYRESRLLDIYEGDAIFLTK